MKHRRCVRDYERLPEHHETYLYWSMIQVMAAHRPLPPPGTLGASPGASLATSSADANPQTSRMRFPNSLLVLDLSAVAPLGE